MDGSLFSACADLISSKRRPSSCFLSSARLTGQPLGSGCSVTLQCPSHLNEGKPSRCCGCVTALVGFLCGLNIDPGPAYSLALHNHFLSRLSTVKGTPEYVETFSMFVILRMISALPFKYSCRGSVRKILQAVKWSCWVVMVMRGGNHLQLFVSSLFSLMELGQTEERKLTTSLYWYILKSRSLSVCVCACMVKELACLVFVFSAAS